MKRKNEQSTRELMGTKELSDYSIRTYRKNLWTHDGIKRHHRNRDDVLKFP